MREEAAVKIDELRYVSFRYLTLCKLIYYCRYSFRNTVNSYENNPLSLVEQNKTRPKSNNNASTKSNPHDESLVVTLPTSSSHTRANNRTHQQQLIQQVALDK